MTRPPSCTPSDDSSTPPAHDEPVSPFGRENDVADAGGASIPVQYGHEASDLGRRKHEQVPSDRRGNQPSSQNRRGRVVARIARRRDHRLGPQIGPSSPRSGQRTDAQFKRLEESLSRRGVRLAWRRAGLPFHGNVVAAFTTRDVIETLDEREGIDNLLVLGWAPMDYAGTGREGERRLGFSSRRRISRESPAQVAKPDPRGLEAYHNLQCDSKGGGVCLCHENSGAGHGVR